MAMVEVMLTETGMVEVCLSNLPKKHAYNVNSLDTQSLSTLN